MRSAAVYSCTSRSNSLAKEVLIYEQLDSALAALADLDHHVLPERGAPGTARQPRAPGLGHVRTHEAIIALGSAAHTILADFQKRTLMTGDLDLDGTEQARLDDDIEQLVWSCSNTMGIVALGAAAWNSVQLLPVAERRFHHVPPLRLAGRAPRSSVLVVDHEADGTTARRLVDVLGRSGLDVEYGGATSSAAPLRDACWSDTALIHVHVGAHTLDSEELRLVDSWRSERLALQLVADRRSRSAQNDRVLMIENEVNGIVCASSEEVVAACQELLDDRVLRQKLISAGQSTVAPLLKTWGAVAEDLLA